MSTYLDKIRDFVDNKPGWIIGGLLLIGASGSAITYYHEWNTWKDVNPVLWAEQDAQKAPKIPSKGSGTRPAPARKLKIKDKSKGYYLEDGTLIAPVRIFDFSFAEGGTKFPSVYFTQVLGMPDYYAFCVEMGSRERSCGMSEYEILGDSAYKTQRALIKKAEDTIVVRLTDEEKYNLLTGKRICGEAYEVFREEDSLKEPWGYPVCFELKKP